MLHITSIQSFRHSNLPLDRTEYRQKTLVKRNLTSLLLLLTELHYWSENTELEHSNFMASHGCSGGYNRNPLRKFSCQQPVLISTCLGFHPVHFQMKLFLMGKGGPRILLSFPNNIEKVHFQIYLMKGQML